MTEPQELPTVTGTATLGGIVAERPRMAVLFERLGLDYCCGGGQTLEEACRGRELDPTTIAAMLTALEEGSESNGQGVHDVAGASIDELCRHIVSEHHEPLRATLPRISELLTKVVRAHGDEDPDVHRVEDLFSRTRNELEEHMAVEEESLFPACRAAGTDGPDGELLARLEDTHSSTGEALRQLRELSHDYRPEAAHCTTHRVLLQTMEDFELDLHRHIHEENNVLFAKVREAQHA